MGIQYDGDCEDQRNQPTDKEIREWQHEKVYGNDCSCCGASKNQCTCNDNLME